MNDLLTVSGLTVQLPIERDLRTVLSDIDLTIGGGESVGVVGESGSGKSMTARSIARLLPPGATVDGSIRYRDIEVGRLSGEGLRRYRSKVAMVFQDPRAHINPVRTIGDFMTESLRFLGGVSRHAAADRAVSALDDVGVPDAGRRLRQYPHELSGGLLQRVMIAACLLAEPELLLADEPTTALDVTTQAEVMAILDELREHRGLSMLFITHDLELAAAVCDRTVVMYAGNIVETQRSARLHERPLHPYTAALAASRPSMTAKLDHLAAVPGRPVSAFEAGSGCPFAPRCTHAEETCLAAPQLLRDVGEGRVACHRVEELTLNGVDRHG